METSRSVNDLAQSLDLITEDELAQLANAKPGTVEAWRKRGKGPAYILFGTRYLYQREAVAEYLKTLVRARETRSAGSAKDLL